MPNRWRKPLLWLCPLLLSACATYHAKPLAKHPDLANQPALTVSAHTFQIPGLKPHLFHPSTGLDETDVVMLADVNNPTLKAERLQAGVAHAQLMKAGLLPNPQLSAGFAYPTSGPPPLVNGYSFGLSEDLRALITRGAIKAQAKARQSQINLSILWQEWQVALKARQLFIQVQEYRQIKTLEQKTEHLNARRFRQDKLAYKKGIIGRNQRSAAQTALMDSQARLHQLQRKFEQTRERLDALLGLRPGLKLKLTGKPTLKILSHSRFEQAVKKLPHRRADLLALKQGYESQQQRVRQAVLGQFPSLGVGVSRQRDTQGVHSIGITIHMSLPIFNHNQGQIAVQRATRSELHQLYQARLDQATSRAYRVWRASQSLSGELKTLLPQMKSQTQNSVAAKRSFKKGDMRLDSYLALRQRLLNNRIKAIELRATLGQVKAVLTTLLGMSLNSMNSVETSKQSESTSN